MREHIFVPVGQAGIRVFARMAENVLGERGLDLQGRGRREGWTEGEEMVLERKGESQYTPRAVLVDPDSSAIAEYTSFGLSALQTVTGCGSSGNNWAQGFYEHGPDLREAVLEQIRRLAERCESVENIHIVHSLGGGSGSGLGVFLLQEITEMFPHSLHSATSILPSPLCSDVVVDPYNALLALSHLTPLASLITLISNAALMRTLRLRYKQTTPCYQDLNHLIAQACSNLIPGYEGSGTLTYRKLVNNLVLWPEMTLVEVGFAPLTCRCLCNQPKTEEEMALNLLNREFSLCRTETTTGKFLSAFLLFRGKARELPLDLPPLAQFQDQWSFPWLPDTLKTAYSRLSPKGLKMSIGLIGGHTGVSEVLEELVQQGNELYSRKAFVHWYTAKGMEMESLEEGIRAGEELAERYRKVEQGI